MQQQSIKTLPLARSLDKKNLQLYPKVERSKVH